VRDNTIDSGGDGIRIRFRESGDTLIDNTITCATDCVVIGETPGRGVLKRNAATAADGASIRIDGGTGYAIERNSATGSPKAGGIALSNVNDSTVTDNTANADGGFGISVSGTANVIERNTANGNALDGIVSVGPNTLTANTARDNGGLGINAVAGAIDGGHNRASGNAEPQCIGVTCTP
jgi:parallel beta-helix repeat protein